MLNKILHAITNRRVFPGTMFPTVTAFQPARLSEAAERVRQLCQLDNAFNNYYVQEALAAIDAFPEIREAFGEEGRTYTLAEFQRAPDTWGGCRPVADTHGPFVMRRVPTSFPVSFDIILGYYDTTFLKVEVDGVAMPVPTSIRQTTLFPVWPAELGISGGLLIAGGQSWNEDFRGVLQHMPTSFPYAAAVQSMEADTARNDLLMHAGLIEHYMSARLPIERYATILLALGTVNMRTW